MQLLLWSFFCFGLVILMRPTVAADRRSRALAFRKGSAFYCKLNYKISSLGFTTVFAQATGFKIAWELPVRGQRASRESRSIIDVQDSTKLLYESHGFDGRSCLLKNICQALEYVSRKDGVIGKILKLLAGFYVSNGTEIHDSLICEEHVRNCPLELIGLSTFAEH